MARFRDTENLENRIIDQGFVHDLVRAELHPAASDLLKLGNPFDPQQAVEEATVQFMAELKDRFQEFSRVFNSYSEAGAKYAEVKIYNVANTVSDFMLYRNQMKFMISNAAHGLVQFGFAQHAAQPLGTASETSSATDRHEILAQVGPFRDVHFTYQGEKVQPEQLAKFFFAEFARLSRDSRPSRTSNQALLEQIKALLQEKGLDL